MTSLIGDENYDVDWDDHVGAVARIMCWRSRLKQVCFLFRLLLTRVLLTIVSNSSSCDLLLTSGGFSDSAGRRKLQCHLPCICKPTSTGNSYHCNVAISSYCHVVTLSSSNHQRITYLVSANPPAQVLFNLCTLLISFSYCHNFIVTMSSSNDLLCLRKSPCMAGTGTANVPKLPNSPFPSSPFLVHTAAQIVQL